jgi:hypothetical protein
MTPNSWPDAMIAATFLLLSGVGFTVSAMVFRHPGSRSERRREQRLAEMSEVLRAVTDGWERSEAWCQERARRRAEASS